jgi:hypothetical protein
VWILPYRPLFGCKAAPDFNQTTLAWLKNLTLPVSCDPQRKTPGIAPKACAVSRQLHWVVRF